ncbi:MAG TPA: hypothetical protein VFL85_01760, partial [Candidatus Saccharimonadales bacterium]|nr:hypothetical protein [Candidatus Saccharimonadales bacterium]
MDLDFRPGKSRQVMHQHRSIPADYLQRRQAEQHASAGRRNTPVPNSRRRLLRAVSRSRARWAAATVVATLLLVALPLLWPTAGSPQSQPVLGNDATLKASKKIFAVDEDPSFHLDFPKPQVGWLDLPSMVGRAAAAEAVRTTVYYDNGQPVNMPARVTPDGSHSFTVQLQPDSRVKPGRYSVVAEWGSGKNVHSVTQNFAWGVLAINTTQAAYMPCEKVHIEMGVLNSRGNTICDAPLQLTITMPNGKSTLQAVSRSGTCKGDTYVTAPDYTATFVPHVAGHYKLDLRLSDSDYRITSEFTVLKSLPYKVSRQGPTRIYPFHPYTMRLQVTPKQHFTGSVTETLPASFAVPNNGGGHVSKTKQAVTISWRANWQAGKTYHLSYTFKAPLVSPAFYYVQPLQLKAQSGQSYTEPRAWQIASDAVITFVQEASADLGAMTSTGHITFNSTAGNTLILILAQTANNQGISNITDSAGNTWVWPATGDSQNPASAYNGSGNNQLNMAYAVNAAAVSWIQIDIPASNKMTYDISEFSNVASTNAVDQSAAAGEGATTTHSTPTITTTNASDLIIGGMNPTGTNTFSNYGSFTPLAAANVIGAGYQVVNTTGSYAFSLTVSASKS